MFFLKKFLLSGSRDCTKLALDVLKKIWVVNTMNDVANEVITRRPATISIFAAQPFG